jgi:hypothetical protein
MYPAIEGTNHGCWFLWLEFMLPKTRRKYAAVVDYLPGSCPRMRIGRKAVTVRVGNSIEPKYHVVLQRRKTHSTIRQYAIFERVRQRRSQESLYTGDLSSPSTITANGRSATDVFGTLGIHSRRNL